MSGTDLQVHKNLNTRCHKINYIDNTALDEYLSDHMPQVDLGDFFISPRSEWKLLPKSMRGIWSERYLTNAVLYLVYTFNSTK